MRAGFSWRSVQPSLRDQASQKKPFTNFPQEKMLLSIFAASKKSTPLSLLSLYFWFSVNPVVSVL